MKAILDDHRSGNGITWMWLHLQRTHALGSQVNDTPLEQILATNSEFVHNEKRICVRLRKELHVVEYVDDEEYSLNGRRVPNVSWQC